MQSMTLAMPMRGYRTTAPLLPLLLTLLVAGCGGFVDTTPRAARDGFVEPVKGQADPRAYRAFTLDNGLRVLLVADAEADKGAAALSVATGSMAEPVEYPGLAHFLEHMLFLGTQKYPEPDAYHEFIARSGGGANAYTALDHTNYFFDVKADAFPEALDRFSQFFVAPLMAQDYVDKEVQAVEQEYRMQIRDDGWRGYMVEKKAMNPAHPASRFTIGAASVLQGDDVQAALRAFYRRWYSADQMALTVVAPLSLDELEALVRQRFDAVPDRDADRFHTTVPMYTELPRRLNYRPLRAAHTLSFDFSLPPQTPHYRAGVMRYVGDLLGHEGEGSLHALLKARGWITSLSAGGRDIGEDDAHFSITLELTETGVAHRAEIERAVFAYLRLVRSSGVTADSYEERARLARLAFEFREKSTASATARSLAPALLRYPPRDVLRAEFAMDEFDPDRIDDVLAQLAPERVVVVFGSPTVATDTEERWFGVPYALEDIPAATVASWRDAAIPEGLTIPAPNPFVPEDLSLENGAEQTLPTRLIDRDGLAFWVLRDASFGVPRAQLRLRIQPRESMASPRGVALTSLYLALVEDGLNAYAYPARLAGLGHGLGSDGTSLTVTLSGYDDKLGVLLDAVLDALVSQELRADRFALFREKLARDLRNAARDRPYEQVAAIASSSLTDPGYPPLEIEAELTRLTLADLERFRAALFGAVAVQALLTGNVSDAYAGDIVETLKEHLPLSAGVPERRPAVRDLRASELPLLARPWPVEHEDASFAWIVQGRDASLRERALFGLLGQMYRPAYFDDLRTERGLGYIVSARTYRMQHVPGLRFIVQSARAGIDELLSLTREFAARFDAETLPNMTEETFESYRRGLISQLRQRDKNPGERSARLWSDLRDARLEFDTREQIALELEGLTREAFAEFHRDFVRLMEQQALIVYTHGKFAAGDVPGTDAARLDSAPKFPRP